MQHLGNGRERLHDDAARGQRGLDLAQRDALPLGDHRAQPIGIGLEQRDAGSRRSCAGAVLPVWRTRCISLMAAEALTWKRSAACRIERPSATARTIRSRRSCDKGAVMGSSCPLTPDTLESDQPIPCNPELL